MFFYFGSFLLVWKLIKENRYYVKDFWEVFVRDGKILVIIWFDLRF